MPRFSPPIPPVLAALRFARGWGAPDPRRHESIETLHLPGRSAPIRALRIYPTGRDGEGRPDSRHPGWVVLHGITVTGLAHPSLVRFARALASAGGHVLVPEIQSWTELDVATERTAGILEGAVAQLAQDPRVLPGGVLLAGFSFGGPQAIRVAASPELRGALRGVLSWGGYASMDAAIRFQFTGTHAGGVLRRPDPYGRWVLGANHLTGVPGCSAMHDVAAGLHELALRSGRYEFDDWDPAADVLKAQLRSRLAPQHREIWDRFVTPADVSARQARGETPVAEGVEAFADAFAQVVRSSDPGLDPVPCVRRLKVPVRLLHGREDALIPWTETTRLARYLRPRTPSLETTITGLFAHSGTEGMGQPPPPPPLMRLEEGARLFQALMGVFRLR